MTIQLVSEIVTPLSSTVILPTGMPGRFPKKQHLNYNKVLGQAVRKKWHTPEEKEIWYTKFSAARRLKTARLHAKQDGRCIFCERITYIGEDSRNGLPKGAKATLEHLVTQSSGGTDHMSNLAMSCDSCNNLRGDMKFHTFVELRSTPEKWQAHLRRLAKLREPKIKKKSEKQAARQELVVWNLAMLFYFRPEWIEVAQNIQEEFRRRIQLIEDRRLAKLANSPLGDPDILVDMLSKPITTVA